jgi:hypothetical protein
MRPAYHHHDCGRCKRIASERINKREIDVFLCPEYADSLVLRFDDRTTRTYPLDRWGPDSRRDSWWRLVIARLIGKDHDIPVARRQGLEIWCRHQNMFYDEERLAWLRRYFRRS